MTDHAPTQSIILPVCNHCGHSIDTTAGERVYRLVPERSALARRGRPSPFTVVLCARCHVPTADTFDANQFLQ